MCMCTSVYMCTCTWGQIRGVESERTGKEELGEIV